MDSGETHKYGLYREDDGICKNGIPQTFVFATVILGVGAFMHGSFECEAASISVHGTFLLCGK